MILFLIKLLVSLTQSFIASLTCLVDIITKFFALEMLIMIVRYRGLMVLSLIIDNSRLIHRTKSMINKALSNLMEIICNDLVCKKIYFMRSVDRNNIIEVNVEDLHRACVWYCVNVHFSLFPTYLTVCFIQEMICGMNELRRISVR